MSSALAPRIDIIGGVTMKAEPSYAPSGRVPSPVFHDSAGRMRSASRSRMSTRTARRPSNAESGELVEGAVEGRVDDHGCPPGGQRIDDIAEAGLFLAVILQRPEQRDQPRRSRLDQRGNENVVGAEAHAEAAQCRPARLVERLDVLGDVAPVDQPEILDELEGDAPADAGRSGRRSSGRSAASAATRPGNSRTAPRGLRPFRGLVRSAARRQAGSRAASAHPRPRPAFRSARRSSAGCRPSRARCRRWRTRKTARRGSRTPAASAFCAAALIALPSSPPRSGRP